MQIDNLKVKRGDFMRKLSIKSKIIVLILLICSFILLLHNSAYAANNSQKFNITHYQRNLYINKQNEKNLRDGVIKLPLVNKTGLRVTWHSNDPSIAIVNQYRICYRYKSRCHRNYC